MKYTLLSTCGECERLRRFKLVIGTTTQWWECPKCGESFGVAPIERQPIKRTGRIH